MYPTFNHMLKDCKKRYECIVKKGIKGGSF